MTEWVLESVLASTDVTDFSMKIFASRQKTLLYLLIVHCSVHRFKQVPHACLHYDCCPEFTNSDSTAIFIIFTLKKAREFWIIVQIVHLQYFLIFFSLQTIGHSAIFELRKTWFPSYNLFLLHKICKETKRKKMSDS